MWHNISTAEAEAELKRVFSIISETRDETFGNARLARNLFEATVSKQANRIVSLPEINEHVLSTIEAADLPDAKEVQECGVKSQAPRISP